jgi:hypothetical protein
MISPIPAWFCQCYQGRTLVGVCRLFALCAFGQVLEPVFKGNCKQDYRSVMRGKIGGIGFTYYCGRAEVGVGMRRRQDATLWIETQVLTFDLGCCFVI